MSEGEHPFIKSGPNKGRIKNPLVAHETYNLLNQQWQKINEGLPLKERISKTDFFKLQHGETKDSIGPQTNLQKKLTESTIDTLIKSAANTIRAEERSNVLKHDELTGLHRNRAYEVMTTDAINRVRSGALVSLGVIRMDLDYFSWVNDFIGGHLFGDKYLVEVARQLQSSVRQREALLFRPGGDEFAVILTDSLTGKSFEKAMIRIYSRLQEGALKGTLKQIGDANRSVFLQDGRTEREATVILKEVLQGLVEIRLDDNNKRTNFLSRARGTNEAKRMFLKRLDSNVDELLNHYTLDNYLDDQQTDNELDIESRKKRRDLEEIYSQKIINIFSNLSISIGGKLFKQDNVSNFVGIEQQIEGLVEKVKLNGGNNYAIGN